MALDVFDEIAPSPKRDVFDDVDIFDSLESEPPYDSAPGDAQPQAAPYVIASPEQAQAAMDAMTAVDVTTAPYKLDTSDLTAERVMEAYVEKDKLEREGIRWIGGFGAGGERPDTERSFALKPGVKGTPELLERANRVREVLTEADKREMATPEWRAKQAGQAASVADIAVRESPLGNPNIFLERMGMNALPAAGALAGARMMTVQGAQGIQKLLPFLGAAVGGALTGATQEKIRQIGETPEDTASRQDAQATRSQSGQAKFADLASMGLLFGPSRNAAEIGVGAGVGAGFAGANAALEGRLPSAEEVGKGIVEGAAFSGQPTRLARGILGTGEAPGLKRMEAAANVENVLSSGEPVSDMPSVSSNTPLRVRQAMRPLSPDEAMVVATEGIDALPTSEVSAEPRVQPIVERIDQAGYQDKSGKIYKTGAFHNASQLPKRFQVDPGNEYSDVRGIEPGWITTTGRFVDRTEGHRIAKQASQVKASYEGPDVLFHLNFEDTPTGEPPKRNLGPGAANIEEPLRAGGTIAAYNAAVDAQRAERGLPPLMSEARKADEVTWDNAEKRIEADPTYPDRLVADILQGRKTSVTDEEQAALLWQRIDLRNKAAQSYERLADESLTPEERVEAESNAAFAEELLAENDVANRKAGTASGRALRSRQLEANEDFTLAAMTGKARTAKGEPLTPEERAEITQQQEKIAAAEKGIPEREAAVDETQSLDAAKESVRQEAAPTYSERFLKWAQSKVAEFDLEAQQAHRDLRVLMGYTSANPIQPKAIAALYKIARAKIARVGFDLARFTADTVGAYGEAVRPFIKPAWDKAMRFFEVNTGQKPPSKKQLAKQAVAAEEAVSTEDGIKAIVAGGETKLDALAPYVKKLAKDYIKSGTNTVEGLEARLHEFFAPLISEVTPRQLRDMFSDYGKSKAAPTDPVKITQAQLRSEAQKLSALEALLKKEAPLRTGQQRVPPSTRDRNLQKQINELKKELGIVDGDPATRLRSTLESLETRTRNRIKDLRFEIAKGERTIKQKGEQPTSPQLDALRAELKTVQAEHEAVFGKREATPEQRLKAALKAAERSEADANAELADAKKGVFRKKAKGAPAAPEVAAIRARAEAAREQVKELKMLANPPLSDAQKALDRALVSKERWDQLLAGEVAPAKKLPKEALTQLEEDARLEIAAMREMAAQMKRDAAPKTSAEEAAIKSLDEATARYEEMLRSGKTSPEGRPATRPDTQKVAEARQRRDDARAKVDEIRKANREKPDPDDATVRALEKAAADYEKRLNDADFSRKGNKVTVDTERVAKARALRDAARKAFDIAKKAAAPPKKTKDEIAIQAYKTRQKGRAADYAERVAKGDFEPRKRVPLDVSKDPEAVRLKAEADAAKQQFEKKQFEWEQAKRNGFKKFADKAMDVLGATRSLKTSMDVSAPLRQGGIFGLGDLVFKPARFFRQMGNMFRSFGSQKKFDEVQASISLRSNADLYKEAGLSLTDLGTGMTAREENMRSTMAELVPGVKGSNRAYTAFLNQQRAEAFDAFVDAVGGRDAVTPEQAKFFAEAVNDMTGRGSLPKSWIGAANAMAKFLFSPRFLLSRFNVLLGRPIFRGLLSGPAVGAKARLAVAAEYGKFAVGAAALLGLAKLAGAEINLDPKSTDFLKMKFGNTRIDVLTGLQQVGVFLSRMLTRKQTTTSGKDRPISGSTIGNFVRGKLAPIPGTAIDLTLEKNVVGEPVTPASAAWNMVSPLSFQPDQLKRLYEEQGPLKGSAIQLLQLMGAGVNTYEKR